jgi:DNA-binding NarL/FixJ family response regulator
MPGTTFLRAFVIDPRPPFGEAMRAYLSKGGHALVGQALDLAEALSRLDSLQPSLLIVGPHVGESGLTLCRESRHRLPTLKILLYTAHADDSLFQTDAADAGVSALVRPESTDEELLTVIAQVMTGQSFFSQEFLALASQPIDLTPREREVLKLMAEGRTDHAMADALGLKVSTVRNHAQRILEKLSVNNRREAVWRAQRRGLI